MCFGLHFVTFLFTILLLWVCLWGVCYVKESELREGSWKKSAFNSHCQHVNVSVFRHLSHEASDLGSQGLFKAYMYTS